MPPTSPAPSTNIPPEQAPKLLVAEPTTLASLPKPVPAVTPRAQETVATAYLEHALIEPRPWNPGSWAKTVPVVTASSPRLAAAVVFLREVLRTPRRAAEVMTLAGQRGISRVTLRRAKQTLRVVKARKVGMRAGWVWIIREGTLWG